MNEQRHRFESLKLLLVQKASKGYEVKEITDECDQMGTLLGYQFDSNAKGGYVYFWSSGVIARQLVDYETGLEIIEDETGTMNEVEVKSLMFKLFRDL